MITVKDHAYKVVSVSKRVMATIFGPKTFGKQRLQSVCEHADQVVIPMSVLYSAQTLKSDLKKNKDQIPEGRTPGFIVAGWDDHGPSIYRVNGQGIFKANKSAVTGSGASYALKVIFDKINPFWNEELFKADIRIDYRFDVIRTTICNAARIDTFTGNTMSCFLITEAGIQKGFFLEKISKTTLRVV
ncbi:OLC1v1036671C2 [Oldenlandia corymbosa var. corymbosa]|nr:OLC1v1036671C2 [Oldenlandia corymbosa var. corymbosa]